MTESDSSSRTEAAFDKDWTKGSILSNLLLLAWPMVVMESLYVISQVVDMIWVVQLPLAFFLPRITTLGVYGLRWAIVASTLSAAIAYIAYFKLGRWKAKRV